MEHFFDNSIVCFFGSGEISPTGRKIHDYLFSKISSPVKVAIIETPAGFQPNSQIVAEKIKGFMEYCLQNYKPQVTIVPARKKGSEFDPNDPTIADLVNNNGYIFLGPGSPTYTVKQLKDSLILSNILSNVKQGSILSLASAAAISVGKYVLPVYEIYKVGQDLYWEEGLNLFEEQGLNLTIITHWNNTEGGKDLDTSYGFMGEKRFNKLKEILLKETTIVGIDEQTALIIDFKQQVCKVQGIGQVTISIADKEKKYQSEETFSLQELKSRF